MLLVSDGVTGTEDDSWLRERLVKFDQGSPKELDVYKRQSWGWL